jgi:hypothetical protein
MKVQDMKNLLYIPQYTMIDKVTGKFNLDADENINILKYLVQELPDYKFITVLPLLEQVDTNSLSNYNFVEENCIVYYDTFPTNNVLQRFHFDMNLYGKIIDGFHPDVIINCVDTNSRALRAYCEMNDKQDTKIFTFVHFIDLPSKKLTKPSYSYFTRQIDSCLASDGTFFLSENNRKAFCEEAGIISNDTDWKHIADTCYNVPMVFSRKEFDGRLANDDVYGQLQTTAPTIIFPNRISSNNYSHHEEFIQAVNELHDEGLEFRVIMTNPSQQVTYDELEKMVKPILFPFGKKSMTKDEYYDVLKSVDYVCALFREIHGGTSIREAIYMGAFPIVPYWNDYALIMDECFMNIPGTVTIEPPITVEAVKEVLKYYIENPQIPENYLKGDIIDVRHDLCRIEGIENNIQILKDIISK